MKAHHLLLHAGMCVCTFAFQCARPLRLQQSRWMHQVKHLNLANKPAEHCFTRADYIADMVVFACAVANLGDY